MAKAVCSAAKLDITGIRPGEKLHEQMIGEEDAPSTYEYDTYYKILPVINGWGNDPERIKMGIRVPEGFTYNSSTNKEWMTIDELKGWISANKDKLGKI